PSLPSTPPGTQTVVDNALVSQHSMHLTGLIPRSTYYFNITAIDKNGNPTVVMAPSFAVPGPTLHDTALADFAAGNVSANTYVSQTADGEVMLAPALGTEFTGPSMPPGWIEMPWNNSGFSVIDDGILMVNGARVATCVTGTNGLCLPETQSDTPSANLSRPQSMEFSAKFSGDTFQHAGFGQTLNSGNEPWAIFSTDGVGGSLFARTNVA